MDCTSPSKLIGTAIVVAPMDVGSWASVQVHKQGVTPQGENFSMLNPSRSPNGGDVGRQSRKLNVVLSAKDYETLSSLAKAQDASVSEVVRTALRIGVWYQKEVAGQDKKLLVQSNDDGPVKELVFMG